MISVLIPYSLGCPYRTRALEWVVGQWQAEAPDAEIILGRCPDGPWRKAAAVRDAVDRSHGEVLVISDADVSCGRTIEAVRLVAAGSAWAVPHVMVYRFSESATERILDGADPAAIYREQGALVESHQGRFGGGIVVLTRDAYEMCPMDPRFAGWGGEDESWGHAIDTVLGKGRRLDGHLWHLWHPPQERLSRNVGSEANDVLRGRYQRARWDAEAMRELLDSGQPVG